MANGRMISRDTPGDKKINQLSTDTSRLAFTWLITFCDREGRTHGDPAMLRSMLFPRRQDVTIEQMEGMILEWFSLGLVVWYECDGDLWIWFPNFSKNQPGLRKDKEAPSKIPEPTEEGTELVRSRYGVGTPEVPLKLKEEKGKEGEGADDAPATPLSERFSDITGILPWKLDEWTEAEQELTRAGVQVVDIENAVEKMKQDQLSYTGLWSVVGTAISVKGKRERFEPIFSNGSKNGKDDGPNRNKPLPKGV